MKPHIYLRRGMWYCIRDCFDVLAKRLGIGADSPTEAYRLAKDHWKW
jgi:hypothetical protein